MKQGWEIKKLGDVLTIERGGSPRPIDKYITTDSDGFNWIKISDATVSTKYIYATKEKISKKGLYKTRLVTEGDFILSNSMSFGRPYIMKTTGCIHDGWLVLRQDKEVKFNTEFLYYLLSSPYVFQQFNYLASGSTVRNLNIALVSSVLVPIPPLPEQEKIVSILDKAFFAIEQAKQNAEKNLKNAKELFDSYLNSIFTNKGDDWEEKSLKEIAEYFNGLTYSPKDVSDSGILVLRSSNIQNDELDFTDNVYVNLTVKDKIKVKENDILMCSRNGSKRLVGKAAKIQGLEVEMTFGTFMMIIRSDSHEMLSWFLKSVNFKEQISQGENTMINQITRYMLDEVVVSMPKNKDMQIKLSHHLKSLQKYIKNLENIYQQKITELESFKKSILQKAFNGELNI